MISIMDAVKITFLVLLILVPSEALLYPQDSESRHVKSLDGIWDFRISSVKDPNQGFREKWYSNRLKKSGTVIPMPVPSSFNDITQDIKIRNFIGVVWYDREFYCPSDWQTQRVMIRVGSAHYKAYMFINGINVVNHTGGSLPFEAEITKYLSFCSPNILTMAVDNTLTSNTLPQGQLTFFNNSHLYPRDYYEFTSNPDFFNYAGIHRTVVLYTTPTSYITDITVTTTFYNCLENTAGIHYTIKFNSSKVFSNIRTPESMRIIATILDQSGKVVSVQHTAEATVHVKSPHLWWPYTMNSQAGYMYQLKVELGCCGTVDTYYQEFGIRTVHVTDKNFFINGKPFYFTGCGKHEDFHIIGRGFNVPLIVKDYNLLKWLGANSFRTSHYPYSETMMRMADRLGIVVIDESTASTLTNFGDTVLRSHMQVMRELIVRDKNHPSVVMWSLANEPQNKVPEADAYFKTMVDFTRSLDSTRPITFASTYNVTGGYGVRYLDVIMINRYYAWYENHGHIDTIYLKVLDEVRRVRSVYTNKPVMYSEYGAETIAGFHTSPALPFSEDYQAELFAQYHHAFDVVHKEGGWIGEMFWNLADFMTAPSLTRAIGNRKGIFTRERQPKAAAKVIRCRYWGLAKFSFRDDAFYCTTDCCPRKEYNVTIEKCYK